MADRPGVIIYFSDIRPAINRLSDSDLGELFKAIIDYAEYGEISDLDNSMTGFIFETLQPKIDRDRERYDKKYLHALYMTYCRQNPEDKRIPETEWLEIYHSTNSELIDNYQLTTSELSDNYQSPTTTTTATATAITTATAIEDTTKKANTTVSVNQSGEKTPKIIERLFTTWNEACSRSDLNTARDIQMQLSRLGYKATSAGLEKLNPE